MILDHLTNSSQLKRDSAINAHLLDGAMEDKWGYTPLSLNGVRALVCSEALAKDTINALGRKPSNRTLRGFMKASQPILRRTKQ